MRWIISGFNNLTGAVTLWVFYYARWSRPLQAAVQTLSKETTCYIHGKNAAPILKLQILNLAKVSSFCFQQIEQIL
eukprot:SAG31_NODE_412_length_15972_cov_3.590626_11_plen_76_part_00